tara:strand:+ start:113 stop:742 length:630 start_codon:yes stop_codon:yes gene_type:complete
VSIKTVFSLVLVFALFACGTIRMDLNTTIRDLEDFSHEMEITATEQLALMLEVALLEDDPTIPTSWDIKQEGDTLSAKFSHRFKGDEAIAYLSSSSNGKLMEDDPLTSFSLTATDTPDGTIYRASYSLGDYSDATEDAETGDEIIPDDMLRGMFLFKWTVEMPGEIVNSNSDSVTESTANFVIDGVDLQNKNELWVESLVKPNSTACNF